VAAVAIPAERACLLDRPAMWTSACSLPEARIFVGDDAWHVVGEKVLKLLKPETDDPRTANDARMMAIDLMLEPVDEACSLVIIVKFVDRHHPSWMRQRKDLLRRPTRTLFN
jgi:hypothetical protein